MPLQASPSTSTICQVCDSRLTRQSKTTSCTSCKRLYYTFCTTSLAKQTNGAFKICCGQQTPCKISTLSTNLSKSIPSISSLSLSSQSDFQSLSLSPMSDMSSDNKLLSIKTMIDTALDNMYSKIHASFKLIIDNSLNNLRTDLCTMNNRITTLESRLDAIDQPQIDSSDF